MDFSLSDEQASIKQAAEEFAKGEFKKEIALEHERAHTFPHDLWKKAAELGFAGIHYPGTCGGQEFGVFENAIVAEAFCRYDSGLGIALTQADSTTEMLLRFGTDEQKEKYLRPVTQGKAVICGAFTEPDHGSDLLSLSTTAIRNGDLYVINGSKMFISNGPIADTIMVLCQTDLNVQPSYKGQSVFVIEKGTAGFSAGDVGEKMGNKMTPTGELSFSDVHVSTSAMVGVENRGFYQALRVFDEIRLEIAAMALGIAQGAFDRALAYTKDRKQFGKPIRNLQVTQHKLADLATKIETARLLVYRAAWCIDHGQATSATTAMAKMYSSRVAVEVCDEAIQLHGGYGYMLEYDVERYYRDARLMELYGGTREIQKNTIAREL